MNLFSTDTLLGVIEGLKTPSMFLLNRYFPTMVQDTSEEIHFDVIDKTRRIAPFVSPLVAGKIVESAGRSVKTFSPAYIKDKRVFDTARPFKRAIGERIGGALTPADREKAYLASEQQDQIEMIDRRLETMAAEALRTGKVTVVGDDYPSVVVNFNRDATLDPAALTGNDAWDDTDSSPLVDLRTWGTAVVKKSGANPVDVLMGVDAYDAFISHADIEKKLDLRNATGAQLEMANQIAEGGTYRGFIGGFNIFTYAGWYVDPADDTEKEIFPAKEVVMTSVLLEGVRAFGAIRDGKAGFQPYPYFPKSWEEEDPAVRYLMMQSAPLVVPRRVNASLKATVLE